MLSNGTATTNQDHRRQRQQQQHRRQQPISTTTNTSNVPICSASRIQRPGAHRRGQSLDQRISTRQLRNLPLAEQQKTVSTIIQGYEQQHQNVLRETQQQRMARPGQSHHSQVQQHTNNNHIDHDQRRLSMQDYASLIESDEYARLVTQQRDNATIRPSKVSGNRSEGHSPSSDIFTVFNPTVGPSDLGGEGTIFDENGRISTRSQNGMHSKDLNDSNETVPRRLEGSPENLNQANVKKLSQRPHTPPEQKNQDFFLMTPAPTPQNRTLRSGARQRHSVDLSNYMGDETIKPPRISKNLCKDLFSAPEGIVQHTSRPPPLQTTARPKSQNFDSAPMPTPGFMNMSALAMEFSGSEGGYDSSYYSPLSTAISPSMDSFQSSPEMAHMSLFDEQMTDGDMNVASAQASFSESQGMGDDDYTANSPSIKRASISEGMAQLDATIEDTGITVDDIAIYIDGPDQEGKWICLFPDCGKRFGRKENIKSHVQTHLGDRQFRCNHCQKCFVRQHDLKRHAKIHSGLKPYPCKCGHSFARHDALTRHRQRGMCIGAFENVQRKVVKRGRPRKHRPEAEERTEKATKTRSKVKERSYASSISGASQSSFAGSPGNSHDSLSSRETTPYYHDSPPATVDFVTAVQGMQYQYTPPASPKLEVDPFLCAQQAEQMEQAPSQSQSIDQAPMQLQSSEQDKRGSALYDTPPDLCLSSSSPAPSKFFDLESVSDHGLSSATVVDGNTEPIFFGGQSASASLQLDFGADPTIGTMRFDDFDMDSAFAALDKDSAMFSKLDEDPWAATDLLQDGLGSAEDVFFGSS